MDHTTEYMSSLIAAPSSDSHHRHVALNKAMQFYDIKNTNVKPEQVVQVAEMFFDFLSGKAES